MADWSLDRGLERRLFEESEDDSRLDSTGLPVPDGSGNLPIIPSGPAVRT